MTDGNIATITRPSNVQLQGFRGGGSIGGGGDISQFLGTGLSGRDIQQFLPQGASGFLGDRVQTNLQQRLGRIRDIQLQDILSSQQLRQALLPGEAQLELDLRGQIIPGQLQALGGELGQAQGIFGGLTNQAISQLRGQSLAGGLLGIAEAGLEGIAEGGLPPDVQRELEQSFFSTAGALGLQGQPAALQPLTQALGSTGIAIQEQIRQSRIGQALGIQQGLGIPGASQILGGGFSLLGLTGLPDIGLNPFGGQFASDLFTGGLSELGAHRGRKRSRQDIVIGGLLGVGGQIGGGAAAAGAFGGGGAAAGAGFGAGSAAGGAAGIAAFCWVAEELYGKDHIKTWFARFYVLLTDTPFTRSYRKHGIKWANWVKRNPEHREKVKAIWDQISERGRLLWQTVSG